MFVRSLYATQDLLSANLTNLNIIYSAVADIQKFINNCVFLEKKQENNPLQDCRTQQEYAVINEDSYVMIKNISTAVWTWSVSEENRSVLFFRI